MFGKAQNERWVIEPRGGSLAARLREAWNARSLVRFLAHRSAEQIVSRTALGYFWLILRPAVPVAVMTFVFGFLANLRDTVDIPYVVFFLYGMAAWSAFDGPVIWGTRSLYNNRSLLSKIYFPRILVPVAGIFPGVMEFVVHIGFLVLVLFYFGVAEGAQYIVWGWGLLVALGCLALIFLIALGITLFTALWDYAARDVRYTIQIVLRFLLYLCPVIYPSTNVPQQYQVLYFMNPLAAPIESFRASALGNLQAVPVEALAYSTVFASALVFAGLVHFFTSETYWIDRA